MADGVIKIDIALDTDAFQKSLDRLSSVAKSSLNNLPQLIKNMESAFTNAAGAAKNLETAASSISKSLQKSPGGTLLDSLKDMNTVVGAFNGIVTAAKTLSGVFGALQSATSLYNVVQTQTVAIFPLMIGGQTAYAAVAGVTQTALIGTAAAQQVLNASMAASPIGPIVIALGALIAVMAAVQNSVKKTNDDFIARTEKANAAMVTFGDVLDKTQPKLGDYNLILSETGQTMSELDEKISAMEDNITRTIQEAITERGGLREQDLNNLRTYMDELNALQEEKLTIYRNQQFGILLQARGDWDIMSQEQKAQTIKDAEETYAQTNEITQTAYRNQLLLLQNQHQQAGTLNSEEYETQRQELQNWCTSQEYLNKWYYDRVLELQTNSTSSEVLAQEDKFNQLNKVISSGLTQMYGTVGAEGKKLEFATDELRNAFNGIDVGASNEFLKTVAVVRKHGDDIGIEARIAAQKMLEPFTKLDGDAGEAGAEVLRGMIKGMEKEIPGLENASNMTCEEIINTIYAHLQINSPSKLMRDQVGAMIVRGIWDGINGMTGWLMGMVRGFCSSIVGSIKSFFDIKSPSRLMRKEVGEMITRGIALGILDGKDEVNKAFDKAFEDLELERAMGLIGEEEYYKKLGELRDQHLTQRSKQWWDATKKLYDGELKQREAARDNWCFINAAGLIYAVSFTKLLRGSMAYAAA